MLSQESCWAGMASCPSSSSSGLGCHGACPQARGHLEGRSHSCGKPTHLGGGRCGAELPGGLAQPQQEGRRWVSLKLRSGQLFVSAAPLTETPWQGGLGAVGPGPQPCPGMLCRMWTSVMASWSPQLTPRPGGLSRPQRSCLPRELAAGACAAGARADGKWTCHVRSRPHLPVADYQAYGWLCSCPTSPARARLSARTSSLGPGLARGSGGAGRWEAGCAGADGALGRCYGTQGRDVWAGGRTPETLFGAGDMPWSAVALRHGGWGRTSALGPGWRARGVERVAPLSRLQEYGD